MDLQAGGWAGEERGSTIEGAQLSLNEFTDAVSNCLVFVELVLLLAEVEACYMTAVGLGQPPRRSAFA